MSNRFRHSAPAFLSLATAMLAASPCLAVWGASNKDYGGSLNMQLYTPSTVAASPAVLVAIHYCTGSANSTHGWFDSAADKNGFYIIAPDAGKQCFDSSATRAGDRADIVKMVQYVVTQKSADKNRVFAAGLSSGGCMTNTLLAIYPDVFVGGSAMPGFPAGTWPAGDTTCSKCGSTPPNNTAQQWGDIARNAFSYSGTRPCVQQWVGGADEYNFNLYLPAVAAQFQNLGNLGSGTSGSGGPSGWTRTVYKDTSGNVRLETNLGPSTQKHDLSGAGLFGYVVTFLGLDKATGSCGITTSTGVGGASGAGGATSTGGTATNTGGTATSTGGVSNRGGATSTGGTATTTGGTATSTGGVSNRGGATSTGGTATTTGGTATSTGGLSNRGGATSTGGVNANSSGGAATGGNGTNPATGGATAGGSTSSGGSPSGGTGLVTTTVGGAIAAVGGGASVGGNSAGGSAVTLPPDAGGCSCRVAGKSDSSRTALGLALLGLVLGRARRRVRRTV